MPEKNHTGLEERTAKVEGILEQMDKRLDRVEVALINLKDEFKADMGKFETSLRSDMGKLETSLRSDMGKFETSLRSDMEKLEVSLRSDMEKLEASLRSDTGKLGTSLTSDISKVDDRIDNLETKLERLEIKTDNQFKWLVGIILATWITAILAIIFKG